MSTQLIKLLIFLDFWIIKWVYQKKIGKAPNWQQGRQIDSLRQTNQNRESASPEHNDFSSHLVAAALYLYLQTFKHHLGILDIYEFMNYSSKQTFFFH